MKTIKLFDTENRFFIGVESIDKDTTTITPLILLAKSKFISEDTYKEVVKKLKFQVEDGYLPPTNEVVLRQTEEQS
jgi:hypothetical protein